MGKNLSKMIKAGDSVLEVVFTYWSLIRDIINSQENGRDSSPLLTIGTDFLEASHPSSRKDNEKGCPSVIISIPKDSPQDLLILQQLPKRKLCLLEIRVKNHPRAFIHCWTLLKMKPNPAIRTRIAGPKMS